MKAYLITTGTLFALIAVAHILRAIDERGTLTTDPIEYWSMAALGLLAAALSFWGWRLLWLSRSLRE